MQSYFNDILLPQIFAARLKEKVRLSRTVFLGMEDDVKFRPSLAIGKNKSKKGKTYPNDWGELQDNLC